MHLLSEFWVQHSLTEMAPVSLSENTWSFSWRSGGLVVLRLGHSTALSVLVSFNEEQLKADQHNGLLIKTDPVIWLDLENTLFFAVYLGKSVVGIETIGRFRTIRTEWKGLVARVEFNRSQIVSMSDQRRCVMKQQIGFLATCDRSWFRLQVFNSWLEIVSDKDDFD